MTPIQRFFFEQVKTDVHHWNQSVVLFSQNKISFKTIRSIFEIILTHHDMLRAFYDEKTCEMVISETVSDNFIFEFHLSDTFVDDNVLNNLFSQLHSDFELKKPPLIKVGLYHTNKGDYLFICAHHLIIDIVSWHILINDIQTLY